MPKLSCEFLRSSSRESVLACIERCQVHMIDFLEKDSIVNDVGISIMDVKADQQVVKSRTLVELDGMQLFISNSKDAHRYPFYLVDSTYGTRGEPGLYAGHMCCLHWIPARDVASPRKEFEAVKISDTGFKAEASLHRKILERTSGIVNITCVQF